jgi:hypothetical protein
MAMAGLQDKRAWDSGRRCRGSGGQPRHPRRRGEISAAGCLTSGALSSNRQTKPCGRVRPVMSGSQNRRLSARSAGPALRRVAVQAAGQAAARSGNRRRDFRSAGPGAPRACWRAWRTSAASGSPAAWCWATSPAAGPASPGQGRFGPPGRRTARAGEDHGIPGHPDHLADRLGPGLGRQVFEMSTLTTIGNEASSKAGGGRATVGRSPGPPAWQRPDPRRQRRRPVRPARVPELTQHPGGAAGGPMGQDFGVAQTMIGRFYQLAVRRPRPVCSLMPGSHQGMNSLARSPGPASAGR